MTMPGKFITLEGGEGAGKSTQIAAIQSLLHASGFEVVVTREPGGTNRAEAIRQLLLQPTSEPMPDVCELLLVFAARSTHLETVIRPALARGAWVICDRFTDATYAYQGAGRGLSMVTIAALEALVQGALRPDLTLLLDAPVALALARAKQRNRDRGQSLDDRFEQEQQQFFERVRSGYLEIAQAHPDRVRVVDASMPQSSVASIIHQHVNALIERHGSRK